MGRAAAKAPFLPVIQVNHRLSEDPHHVQANHGIHDLGAVTERLTRAMKKIMQFVGVYNARNMS